MMSQGRSTWLRQDFQSISGEVNRTGRGKCKKNYEGSCAYTENLGRGEKWWTQMADSNNISRFKVMYAQSM